MKGPGPRLQAKGVDEKVLCLHGRCQRQVSPFRAVWSHKFNPQEQRATLPPGTLTGSWHPCTAPPQWSMQTNKAALQQAGSQEFAKFWNPQAWPLRDVTLGIPVCSPAKLPSLSYLSYPDLVHRISLRVH